MKFFVERLLNKLGYLIVKKSTLINPKQNNSIEINTETNGYDFANARGKVNGGLQEMLKSNLKLKWLEVGTGGRRDEGFDYIDIIDFPPDETPPNYKKINIVSCTAVELSELGKYDFIRMQHVFEHFTPEDGLTVLNNCYQLLNHGGIILISTPNIDIVINSYLNGSIKKLNGGWGIERFTDKAPDSFYFSIFTHSVLSEPHMWCYNPAGLQYQLERTGKFKNIEILELSNPKAAIPFTHNRPQQDVVIIAEKN